VLIAHSHGGNVCSQAVRELGHDSRVVRLICLSTPFLVDRMRDVSRLGRSLFLLLPGAPLITLYGLWVTSAHTPWWIALPVLPLVWFVGAALGLVCLSFCNYLKPDFRFPAPDRLTIVRMPGDEASSAIAVATFLEWIVFQLWNIVRTVPGGMLAVGWRAHSRMALARSRLTRGLAYPVRVATDLVGFVVAVPAAIVALIAVPLSWIAGAGHLALACIYFSVVAEASPPGRHTVYQFRSREIAPLDEHLDPGIGRPIPRYGGTNKTIAAAHDRWYCGPDLLAPVLAHSEVYDHPEVLELVVKILDELSSAAGGDNGAIRSA
jgi:hypothetical protein